MKRTLIALLLSLVLSGCSIPVIMRSAGTMPAPAATTAAGISAVTGISGPLATKGPDPVGARGGNGAHAASPAPDAAQGLYVVTVELLFFRSSPKVDDANVVALLPKGMAVEFVGDAADPFAQVRAPDGAEGYCSAQYLAPAPDGAELKQAVAYAYVTPAKLQGKDAAGRAVTLSDTLVDVRKYAPGVLVNMIFATDQNFTHKALYPKDWCLLQKGTAQKLAKAEKLFEKDGYRIKLYDAYRPLSVQKTLWDTLSDTRYVANPATGSMHNRGCAVDITLVNKSGKEIEMPTPLYTFSQKAWRAYSGMTKAARANLDYMTKVMRSCGFTTIDTSWWQFTDTDSGKYPITDYDFTKIYPIYEAVGD